MVLCPNSEHILERTVKVCPHFRYVDQGHAICRRDVPYPEKAPICCKETCEEGDSIYRDK